MIHNEVLQLRFTIQIGDDAQAGDLHESGERMRIDGCGGRSTSTGLNRLLGCNRGSLCISIFGEVLEQASSSKEQACRNQHANEPCRYCRALAWAYRLG